MRGLTPRSSFRSSPSSPRGPASPARRANAPPMAAPPRAALRVTEQPERTPVPTRCPGLAMPDPPAAPPPPPPEVLLGSSEARGNGSSVASGRLKVGSSPARASATPCQKSSTARVIAFAAAPADGPSGGARQARASPAFVQCLAAAAPRMFPRSPSRRRLVIPAVRTTRTSLFHGCVLGRETLDPRRDRDRDGGDGELDDSIVARGSAATCSTPAAASGTSPFVPLAMATIATIEG